MDATDDTAPTMPSLPPDVAGEVINRLEDDPRLDAVAANLQRVADQLIPPGTARDRWRGSWLGHPLHPMLTDVPVGMWTSALVLDVVGGRGGRRAADRLIAWGVVTAVPTAVAGVAELADIDDHATRRVGAAHALGNAAGTALYALSWRARHRGRRIRGMALSLAGVATLSASGWLGGHLAYRRGAGVSSFRASSPGKVGGDVNDEEKDTWQGPLPR